jgi:hypothetical protein
MKGPDASETRVDNPKDEPKLDEPKEGSPQKELRDSTANE